MRLCLQCWLEKWLASWQLSLFFVFCLSSKWQYAPSQTHFVWGNSTKVLLNLKNEIMKRKECPVYHSTHVSTRKSLHKKHYSLMQDNEKKWNIRPKMWSLLENQCEIWTCYKVMRTLFAHPLFIVCLNWSYRRVLAVGNTPFK